MLAKAARDKRILGAKVCKGAPRVSHLFSKANLQECSVIAEIISKYERASGQMVNLSKAEVVFSKCVNIERRQQIVDILLKKIHWHSWEALCLPNRMGGLGYSSDDLGT
ncbi:hypothetical protein POM88_008585 [Heracleum sosnowskyi]|uniref:Reverse transcriptase n=1 Tax=Heracleum sosnowskyi TaxID=360622 RepID=A0AAD8J6P2_9APIA|nr:hypothetical protein POM88_008585 [Heracleum sosnowskyi]